MGHALLYPEPESASESGKKGGRGKKGENKGSADSAVPFSATRLKQARYVLRHSPELAKSVMAGYVSLDEALGKVKADEKEKGDRETLPHHTRSGGG
jgi:hypothetical protein